MKRKISIILKVLFLVSLLVILLTSALLINLILDKNDFLSNNARKQVYLYGDLIDSYFGNVSRLNDDNYTNQTINEFMFKNRDYVLSLDIVLPQNPDPPYKLIVAESSDKNRTGSEPEYKEFHIKVLEKPSLIIFEEIPDTNRYVLVERLDLSDNAGKYIATYQLVLDLEKDFQLYETYISNTINMAILVFSLMFVATIFIVYILIQKPLSKLKQATISLGKGNLDARADINSRDEFGELSNTFNQMAQDLKKSRNKIEEYNRILEKIIDQKDEFIGQLGHDLKNPMQPLVGLLPILIEKEKDSENKEMLEVMNANVEYMQDLIFDTLKLAKLRSDNIDFEYEKIDLRELSDKIIKTQKTMLKEKNIEIKNKIKDNIFVYADKLRLSEVFKNLINNSVKYTEESGGKITIDASEEDKDYVKISLKDTGIGMTKDQLKKVFDEFYKADRQTSDYHSTGLGLPICKRIVEKHGGKIWVESEGPKKGSTFNFTIKKYNLKSNNKD